MLDPDGSKGVYVHVSEDTDDGRDYEADADHVAIPDLTEAQDP